MKLSRIKNKKRNGQAMVEFAFLAPLLFTVIFAIFDFSYYFFIRLQVADGVREGARYAAVYPTAWSNAADPVTNTIQGQITDRAPAAALLNDDTHIVIDYYDITGATRTLCGYYSASTNAFVAQGTYTQTTCIVPGAFVIISVTYRYKPLTPFPFISGGVDLTEVTHFVLEQ